MRAIQRFEVSLKAFIVRDGAALFVREADSGFWELPGGRIDVGEEWEAQDAVLSREVREELGDGMALEIADTAVTWMRQRPSDGAFLFLVARPALIVRGEPQLSGEHDALEWVRPEASMRLHFPELSGYADGIRRLWQLVGRG